MSVRKVDFRRDRHINNSKRFLKRACHAVESLDGRLAGYAVVAWDDSGLSYTAYKSGGPVSTSSLNTYVTEQLLNTSIESKND